MPNSIFPLQLSHSALHGGHWNTWKELKMLSFDHWHLCSSGRNWWPLYLCKEGERLQFEPLVKTVYIWWIELFLTCGQGWFDGLWSSSSSRRSSKPHRLSGWCSCESESVKVKLVVLEQNSKMSDGVIVFYRSSSYLRIWKKNVKNLPS